MAKIIQCSDLHVWDDMAKLKAIKDHSNVVGADAVFMLGDLIEGINLAKKAQNKADMRQFAQLDSLFSPIKDKQTLEQMLEQSNVPQESREAYRKGYGNYMGLLNVVGSTVVEESRKVYKKADAIFSEFRADVYSLPGNHDPITFYEMKNTRHIDRTGPFSVKGIKFLGAVNSYERIMGLPAALFPHLSLDPVKEQLLSMAEKYEQAGLGKKEQIIKEMILKNPEYQRVMKSDFEYLLTHKGIDEMAMEGNKDYGSGAALSTALSQKRGGVKGVLGGHIHYHNVFNSNDLVKIRSAPHIFYEMDIDEKDKEIKRIQIYEI